jgi:hypothetical protein
MRASSHLDGCCGNDPFPRQRRSPAAKRRAGVQKSCPKSTPHSRQIHKVLRLSPWDIYSATLASADHFRHAK